jgi:hypothetical protein
MKINRSLALISVTEIYFLIIFWLPIFRVCGKNATAITGGDYVDYYIYHLLVPGSFQDMQALAMVIMEFIAPVLVVSMLMAMVTLWFVGPVCGMITLSDRIATYRTLAFPLSVILFGLGSFLLHKLIPALVFSFEQVVILPLFCFLVVLLSTTVILRACYGPK